MIDKARELLRLSEGEPWSALDKAMTDAGNSPRSNRILRDIAQTWPDSCAAENAQYTEQKDLCEKFNSWS